MIVFSEIKLLSSCTYIVLMIGPNPLVFFIFFCSNKTYSQPEEWSSNVSLPVLLFFYFDIFRQRKIYRLMVIPVSN